MNGAQLVAIRISHISQVQSPHATLPKTRRLFNRRAAIRYGCVVELVHLFRRDALKSDGATVSDSRLFSINRLADAKDTAIVPVEETCMASRRLVSCRFTCTQCSKYSVIKAL